MLIQFACEFGNQSDPDALLLQSITMSDKEFAEARTKELGRALKGLLISGEVNLDDALRHSNTLVDRAEDALTIAEPEARDVALAAIEKELQPSIAREPEEKDAAVWLRVLKSQPQTPDEEFAKVLVNMILPAGKIVVSAELRSRASQQVVDLALAARIHEARTGKLPSSLEDLKPIVEEVTLFQPLTGVPIGLRADDDGILIYHWGRNQKDDGGVLDEAASDWGLRIQKRAIQ
jgi:hypothetical protein